MRTDHMAPTRSDDDPDAVMPSSPEDTDFERWTIQGNEALVSRDPNRVTIEWRRIQPLHYEVRLGDRLKNADADVSSPRIDEWVVTDITPTEVVGDHATSGDSRRFDRADVERGLVIGRYATDLSAFPRVAVHTVGNWDVYDPEADDTDVVYRGRPYVTVVAHGNNGRTYGLRYRFTDGRADAPVTLWETDVSVDALDESLRARLSTAVEAALGDAGHAVV